MILLLLAAAQDFTAEADAALQRGEYDRAIELYDAALAGEPASHRAQMGRARALGLAGRRAEAIEAYTVVLDVHNDDADARLARGRLLAWENRFDEAIADLERVVSEHPEYADAWSALGDAYRWAGRDADADRAYARMHELDPQREIPPPPEPERLWEASLRYAIRTFESRRTPWHEIAASVRRRFELGSFALEGLHVRRFDRWDDAVAGDAWIDLWQTAYVNVRVQYSGEAEILPHWDYSAELYQSLGSGWEIAPRYRHMSFPSRSVDIIGLSFGKYIGSWYLRVGAQFVSDHVSYAGQVRYYFNDEDFVELRGGVGESTVHLGRGGRTDERSNAYVGVRGEFALAGDWFGNLGVAWNEEEDVPDSWTFSAGVSLQW